MLRRNCLIVVGTAVLLGGCAYDGDRDDYVVGTNAGYDDYAVGANASYQDVYYDGYYDGYYGPFYDGYWGTDGFFYFSDADGRFNRDAGGHFRRTPDAGFMPIRGRAEPRSDAMPNHP